MAIKKTTKRAPKSDAAPKQYASIGQLTKARDQGHARALVVELDLNAKEGFLVRDRSGAVRLRLTIQGAIKALCADRGLRKVTVDGVLQ